MSGEAERMDRVRASDEASRQVLDPAAQDMETARAAVLVLLEGGTMEDLAADLEMPRAAAERLLVHVERRLSRLAAQAGERVSP